MSETKRFSSEPVSNGNDGGLQIDSVLMNRYRIIGIIGGGGMGTVFQARDTNFPEAKRLVAVKEMIPPVGDVSQRDAMLKTFQREANLLAALSHPAIPKIFDFFTTDIRAYLVMEFINGSDLDALLARTRTLPIDKVVEWGIELCDVLEYLHNQKPQPIVFRDIKPANIMVDSLGKVRLIDFGIAKIFESEKKHTMIGTEGYSAPEQYRGEVKPQSDIYGLGATLHHVLTRKDPRVEPPFSFTERPISAYNPMVSRELISIIERALAHKPEDRYANCGEMKADLVALQRTASGMLRAPVSAGKPGTVNAVGTNEPGKETTTLGEAEAGGTIEPRWVFRTEDEIRASPMIYKGVVYVGSYDTNMWAVSATDGKMLWKYPTGAGIATTPTVDEASKVVLFGGEDHTFYALDAAAGRIAWTYNTRGKIRSSPRVAHNYVFFGSDDGKLYVLVAATGRYLWAFDASSPIRTRPFVTNDLVIFGADDGNIYGLELSGKRKWAFRAKRSVNSSPFVDVAQSICYIGSFDGHLYGLDANSGYTLWRFRTNGPVISTPAFSGDTVYIGSADGSLYAVSADSGKERWHFDTGKPIVGSPIVINQHVYVGGTNGIFYCIDARSGKLMWNYTSRGQVTSTPTAADNVVVFGSMDRNLYAMPFSG